MEATAAENARLEGEYVMSNADVASPIVLEAWIAGGAFGMVYRGVNEKTQKKVAIKLERKDAEHRQLYLEFGFYRRLGRDCDYVPRVHFFGYVSEWNALVLDLLGPSLLNLLKTLNRFSPACTAAVGADLFKIFEKFHGMGLICRDVKPQNFLVGPPETENAFKVYLIDLGLAKEWQLEDGGHIPFATNKVITGTPAYVSLNMHKLWELSRRDDLESALYMLIQLQKGSLPWFEKGRTLDAQTGINLYGQMKRDMPVEEICAQMSPHFIHVFKQVRKLKFEEDPDYSGYINNFGNILTDSGVSQAQINRAYDWNPSHKKRLSNRRSRGRRSSDASGSRSPHQSRSKERPSKESAKKKTKKGGK